MDGHDPKCATFRALPTRLGALLITEEVGKRIRELRNKTGLSQEKFAAKIGMDRTYFASIELGKRNVALKNIEKIANGLDVPLSDLFKGI